jgi:hypothetical protein
MSGLHVRICSVHSPYNSKDKADQDNKLNDSQHVGFDDSIVAFIDGVEKSRKKSKGSKSEWRKADVVQDCRAFVECSSFWIFDFGQVHGRSNKTSEAEYDQEEPSRGTREAMLPWS